MDFEEELINLMETKSHGFDARLKEVTHTWQSNGVNIIGRFFYLKFKNGQPSLDEFVEYIYGNIVPFCIPYSVRQKMIQKFEETGEYAHLMRLTDKARNLFIRAKNQSNTTGEPAELILFLLLEIALQAPQIACKMYLKTSQNMPVHGSDGIHVAFNSSTDVLQLFWGESKLYQQLSSALDDICSSISNFTTNNGTGAPRQRDLEILTDHLSIDNEEMKEHLLKYFDPYEELSNNVEEYHACFVGFDYNLLDRLDTLDPNTFVENFEERYLTRIESACNLFIDKIHHNNLQNLNFVFFLIPFNDVSQLRTKFLEKLGVTP